MKRPVLVRNWRAGWKFLSVWGALVLSLLSIVQAEGLPYLQPFFAPDVWPRITGALGLLIIVLRFVYQAADDEKPETPQGDGA